MALEVVEWVMDHAPRHGAGPRGVLIVIAWHANRDGGESFPSQATIAHKSGQDARSVRRSIGVLENEGSIRRTGHRPNGGAIVWRVVMDPDERNAIRYRRAAEKAYADHRDEAAA